MGPNLARTRADKTALRQALLAWREALPADVRAAAQQAIADHLVALLHARAAKRVGAFWPIRSEPVLRDAWSHLQTRGVTLALPGVTVRDAPMQFHAWDGARPATRDAAGVPAPIEAPIVDRLDALVVPCLGYDAHGYRLGYGGGYFDRTLAALAPRPFAIGIAFAAQLCDFAHEAHDVRLDAIVNEFGVRLAA